MPLDNLPRRAPRLARTAERVPTPPIPACRAWADGFRGQLIDLTQAVPGYPPHPGLLARIAAAAADPAIARYGLLEGEPAFRDAVAEETRLVYGGDVQPADVRITAGANVAFNLAMTAIAAPGDAVLLPAPWFFNHQMSLALRGVEALALPCEAATGFLPDPDRAAALLGPRVRALVLVTPNNPTGAVMPPALIARLAELCRERGAWLVLDETYRDFLPGDRGAPHALFERPDWRDFVVQICSFSKAYCVPGHRMGSVVAGPALADAFMKAVDNIQICPPRPPQHGLAWAVPALRDWRRGNALAMADRGDAFLRHLEGAEGWRVDASGAYFAWLRIPEAATDAAAVARLLAHEQGLVTLPGSVFGPGGDRHLRLAYPQLAEAEMPLVVDRLRAWRPST
jgi:aspartate/methionine/tyrosine aminotransferase